MNLTVIIACYPLLVVLICLKYPSTKIEAGNLFSRFCKNGHKLNIFGWNVIWLFIYKNIFTTIISIKKNLSNLFKDKYTMKSTFNVKKIDHFNYKISKPKITWGQYEHIFS